MTKPKKKVKTDILIKILLILITISLIFISYSLNSTKKILKTTQTEISAFKQEVSNLETDIRFIKLDIGVLRDETGWEGIISPTNKKKDSLDSCLDIVNNTDNIRSEDATALFLMCIGNYLAD